MESKLTQPKRARRLKYAVAVAGAMVASVAAAGSASAAITITTPSSPHSTSSAYGEAITVEGSAGNGNYVLAAVCNVDLDPTNAGYCRQYANEVTQADATTGDFGLMIYAPFAFQNYDLITNAPSSGVTICNSWFSGDDCAIQLSEYTSYVPGLPGFPTSAPVGFGQVDLDF